jgi:hypothetical protein
MPKSLVSGRRQHISTALQAALTAVGTSLAVADADTTRLLLHDDRRTPSTWWTTAQQSQPSLASGASSRTGVTLPPCQHHSLFAAAGRRTLHWTMQAAQCMQLTMPVSGMRSLQAWSAALCQGQICLSGTDALQHSLLHVSAAAGEQKQQLAAQAVLSRLVGTRFMALHVYVEGASACSCDYAAALPR